MKKYVGVILLVLMGALFTHKLSSARRRWA